MFRCVSECACACGEKLGPLSERLTEKAVVSSAISALELPFCYVTKLHDHALCGSGCGHDVRCCRERLQIGNTRRIFFFHNMDSSSQSVRRSAFTRTDVGSVFVRVVIEPRK